MLSRLIHIIIAGIMLAIAMPAMALDRILTDEEELLIHQINAHNSSIKTMAGRFEQIDSNGGRVEGVFYIDRPNKVRFRYGPPSREEIISVGRGFYIIDRREKTKYAYPQEQIPLRQFLSEEINLFEANIVDVVSSIDYISVTISDDTPIGTVEVTLTFEIATKDIKQWTLTEPSGAQLTFSMSEVQTGMEIPKSFFYINPTYTSRQPGS